MSVVFGASGRLAREETHAVLAATLNELYGADDSEALSVLRRFSRGCTPPADWAKVQRIWRASAKHQGYDPPAVRDGDEGRPEHQVGQALPQPCDDRFGLGPRVPPVHHPEHPVVDVLDRHIEVRDDLLRGAEDLVQLVGEIVGIVVEDADPVDPLDLIAEHRRAKVVGRATRARTVAGPDQDHAMDRMKSKVRQTAAENAATSEVMVTETLEDKFKALEHKDQIELELAELKNRQKAGAA